MHAGYDHGYYFIQTFVEEHFRWHARQLQRRHDAVRDAAAGDS
jgi:S-formylglutathione hydrolase FrmB